MKGTPKKKCLLFRVRHGKIPDAKLVVLDGWLADNDGALVELWAQRCATRHSDAQRAYWFGVVVPAVASATGYTFDEAHDALMWECWPEGRRELKLLDGAVYAVRATFTTLSTTEVSELMERAWRLAAEKLGLYIDSPDEYREARNEHRP